MSRLQQLFQFLENSPEEPFLLFAIAKEYEGMGDTENAFKFYVKLTDDAPYYVGTYYHLGKLYEKNQLFDKALKIGRNTPNKKVKIDNMIKVYSDGTGNTVFNISSL